MIEQGIALLVQGTPAVAAIATSGGGFISAIPKDIKEPSWTQTIISDPADFTLQGDCGLHDMRLQISCFAEDSDDVVALAAAIDTVLNGYRGTLADTDLTVVQGIFRLNRIDLPLNSSDRSYGRVLDYRIRYNQG